LNKKFRCQLFKNNKSKYIFIIKLKNNEEYYKNHKYTNYDENGKTNQRLSV